MTTARPSIALILVAICLSATAQTTIYSPRVQVGDRLVVPLRGVLETLGFQVTFTRDEGRSVIWITPTSAAPRTGVQRVSVTVDSKQGTVERLTCPEPLLLDVAPRVIAGKTYVPLRFVAETFGYGVDYQGDRVDFQWQGETVVRLMLVNDVPTAAPVAAPVTAPAAAPSIEMRPVPETNAEWMPVPAPATTPSGVLAPQVTQPLATAPSLTWRTVETPASSAPQPSGRPVLTLPPPSAGELGSMGFDPGRAMSPGVRVTVPSSGAPGAGCTMPSWIAPAATWPPTPAVTQTTPPTAPQMSAPARKSAPPSETPFTAWRKVDANDLSGLSEQQLSLMRSEIYARHGGPVDDPDAAAYLQSQGRYKRDGNFTEGRLSAVEKYNADYIKQYQARRFGTAAVRP